MTYRLVTLHKPFLFLSLFFLSFNSYSQLFSVPKYPQGYFLYPVGAKIGLAANFGELRPNHYHMGLDCRTDQKQNLPVYAAADGYVAKVGIDATGFGRAIYINHPNGFTTLYGHLNDLFPELERALKQQQYKQESWKGSFEFSPALFPVKKGQFIAYSGNTGGSQGPHVHFEIRDTKTDKVLNPLLFGFPIKDDVPPTILRLAVYDRCVSTYSQSPKLLGVKKVKDVYIPSSQLIIVNTEEISFGISANDKVSGSANPNGIFEALVYDDDKLLAGFQLNDISYDETRYLNAHIDYKTKLGGGPFIEHLSRLPGYPPYPEGVYKDGANDGVIKLTNDSLHRIRILVKDAYQNVSVLQFAVKRGVIKENKIVDSALHQKEFRPGYVNVFENEDLQVILGERDLYDSVNFAYNKKPSLKQNAISSVYSVLSGLIPSHGFFTIRLKADKPVNANDNVIMERTWGGKTDVYKAERSGDWYTAKFRSFGNFQLLVDNVPPTISAIGIRENANLSRVAQIVFIPKDENIAIKNFRAELDGKWLRFTNDKGKSFIYKFDEMCQPGNHELKVSVEDEAGNSTTKIFNFTR